MQTTLRINDATFRRAKAKAGELGMSLTRFFEEAVERRLEGLDQPPRQRMVLPVSSVSGPPMSDDALKQRIEAADLEDDVTQVSDDEPAGH
jgi:hypothetical protein